MNLLELNIDNMKRHELWKIIFTEMCNMINKNDIYDWKMIIEWYLKYEKDFTTSEWIKKLIREYNK